MPGRLRAGSARRNLQKQFVEKSQVRAPILYEMMNLCWFLLGIEKWYVDLIIETCWVQIDVHDAASVLSKHSRQLQRFLNIFESFESPWCFWKKKHGFPWSDRGLPNFAAEIGPWSWAPALVRWTLAHWRNFPQRLNARRLGQKMPKVESDTSDAFCLFRVSHCKCEKLNLGSKLRPSIVRIC